MATNRRVNQSNLKSRKDDSMKRTVGLIILAAMVLAAAGNAAAVSIDYFQRGSLTAIATDYATKNVGYDLGNITNPAWEPVVSLSSFGASTTWDKVRVGMFSSIWNEEGGDIRFWLTLNKSTTPDVSASAMFSFDGSDLNVKNYLASQNPGQPISAISNTAFNSYDIKMSSNANAPGYYGGFNNIIADGEVNLASFAAEGLQTATAYLYQFTYNFETGEFDLNPGSGGNPYQRIITIHEGSAAGLVGGPAVPIPGAVYLLATGLVGLVGLRRRMK